MIKDVIDVKERIINIIYRITYIGHFVSVIVDYPLGVHWASIGCHWASARDHNSPLRPVRQDEGLSKDRGYRIRMHCMHCLKSCGFANLVKQSERLNLPCSWEIRSAREATDSRTL
jgi:hypothetical protein